MHKSIWLLSALPVAVAMHTQAAESDVHDLGQMLVTAKEELKQAPGVSIITEEDLAKRPVSNDLSEVIRTMPGVNLTGNSTSGQRGNNRQIDIRGMGPENTLILIDGRPASSRMSVRYGWRGERDSRGDTNWVPMEAVERIEVLRGPAAARYGSGAAGGVVNIITKGVPDQLSGQVTAYMSQPQSSKDGASRRTNFILSGPLSDKLGFRLTGNVAKTDSDDRDINRGHQSTRGVATNGTDYRNTYPAGREGVRNRDLAARLVFQPVADHQFDLDASFSRQGNIYTGDTQNTNNFTTNSSGNLVATSERVDKYIGRETNIMYRENYAFTHRGEYDFGRSLSYVQYEKTRNRRLDEGLAGGTEGLFSDDNMTTSTLNQYQLHTEFDMPVELLGLNQMLTVGGEWTHSTLNDGNSMTQTTTEAGAVPGLAAQRNSRSRDHMLSFFIEDNIELNDKTLLTPGLRYDKHSVTGGNWSPALNLSHEFAPDWTVKAGIARAYKAPNLYQTNPNYLLYSRGIGCWGAAGACYLQGNKYLKAETSVNKELGVEYAGDNLVAGLTWFHNSYRNKVEAGTVAVGQAVGGSNTTYANADVFTWDNVPRAVIEGLEGTFNLALTPSLYWSNNLTWMLQSKNKSTGESLSIIPEFTLNSRLEWQTTDALSLYTHVTWYGKQTPNKYDYQGKRMSGEEQSQLSPYALVGVGGRYVLNDQLSFTGGIDNLFNKRLYRKGNAVGVGDPRNIYGAGAATYNEPGRSFYASATYAF
ncbi:TonB-dependent siderophore receptor [Thiopseudomonas denitrificans]|uniref:Ferric enterobactin receptor n=1 Tax=Thiopseudomonas denitrificans TaxID=1501432 RepID=A0A4V3D4L5_9GAMM|nr:TonB-dependent siderophore receptor [Thiopseudomonas denitrificans]TDQ36507.1 ferric enterobactin receptor [Thiopseudomonas denitrificans]